jgi:hypothetical protein
MYEITSIFFPSQHWDSRWLAGIMREGKEIM